MTCLAMDDKRTLDVGAGHLHGVEVGTVGRQKAGPCADGIDAEADPKPLAICEVVYDDDVTGGIISELVVPITALANCGKSMCCASFLTGLGSRSSAS